MQEVDSTFENSSPLLEKEMDNGFKQFGGLY